MCLLLQLNYARKKNATKNHLLINCFICRKPKHWSGTCTLNVLSLILIPSLFFSLTDNSLIVAYVNLLFLFFTSQRRERETEMHSPCVYSVWMRLAYWISILLFENELQMHAACNIAARMVFFSFVYLFVCLSFAARSSFHSHIKYTPEMCECE